MKALALAAGPPPLTPQFQPPAPRRPGLFEEISANDARFWLPQPRRLANPDELVGRRGLRIYSEMRTDDQVWAALKLKKHAVLSTGWDVVPPDDADPQETAAAAFVKWNLEEGMTGTLDDDLLEVMTSSDFGFSCTELVWTPVLDGDWAGRIGLKKLATRRPHDFLFVTDTHDNLLPDGIEQFGKRFPRDRFVLYASSKEFDNWYGTSDLRPAYRAWWFKDNVLRWWGIFLDRYGIPLAVGKVPREFTGQAGEISDLRTALDRLQSATSMTLPNDIELEFPAIASAQGAQVFSMAVEKADMAIARALLLPNLLGVSAQGDVGSYSQARKQFDVFILIIEKLQRDLAEIVMGEQVIKPLVQLNFDVQRYPTFVFLPFTESNKGELLGMFNQAIAAGAVRPRPPDEVHVRSMTEFPEVPLEEIEAEYEAEKAKEAGGGGGGLFPEAPGGEGGPGGPGPEGLGGPGAGEGELSDEELDALIEEALGGGGEAGSEGEEDALTDQVAEALRARGVKVFAFDEAEHPREPAGSEEGGQFAPAGGGGMGRALPSMKAIADYEEAAANARGAKTIRDAEEKQVRRKEREGSADLEQKRRNLDNTNAELDKWEKLLSERKQALKSVGEKHPASGQFVEDASARSKMSGSWSRTYRGPNDDQVKIRHMRGASRQGVGPSSAVAYKGGGVAWEKAFRGQFAREQADRYAEKVFGIRAFSEMAVFDESEHPREPAGSEGGGQFAPKGGGRFDVSNDDLKRAQLRVDDAEAAVRRSPNKTTRRRLRDEQRARQRLEETYWSERAPRRPGPFSAGDKVKVEAGPGEWVDSEVLESGTAGTRVRVKGRELFVPNESLRKFAADQISRADISAALAALREEQPDLDDEELIEAAVERLAADGSAGEEEEPETFARKPAVSDEELDALIEEALGEAGSGGEPDEEEEEPPEGPAGAQEPTDEEVALALAKEHPDWDAEQVKAAVEEWRAAREKPPEAPGEGEEEAARESGEDVTDEELDALIDDALGGSPEGEGEEQPENEEKPEPAEPKAEPGDETSRRAELEAAVREEHPDWDDEQVAAEVEKRLGVKEFVFEESEHPREGAGSPEGGQFAPKGGGGAGGDSAKESFGDFASKAGADEESIRHVQKEISRWAQGAKREAIADVVGAFENFPAVRKASLYQMYLDLDRAGSFDDFMRGTIEVYRGGGRPTFGEGPANFTIARGVAERFAEAGGALWSATVQVKQIVGYLMRPNGELLVPEEAILRLDREKK